MAAYIKVGSINSPTVPQYWQRQITSPTQSNIFYNDGFVGLGVPLPYARLHVDGNASIGSAFATVATPPANGLIVSGNVGIGTANPTQNLHVAGNILATGTITGTLSASSFTGTLGVANGGTGNASYAVGDLIYASGATALSKLADIATGNALISGGVGVAPAWGKVGLTTHVTGTLGVANGGTGAATLTASKVLVGNGTTAVLQPTNLHWDNTNSRLGIQNTAPLALLHIGAGTATVPPMKFTTGVNLTTVAEGSLEYDGRVFYGSPDGGYRGNMPMEATHVLSVARAFTNVATAQQIFPTNINLIAATTYKFEMMISKARTGAGTTANNHTLSLSFAGTATYTSIAYNADVSRSATDNTPTASTCVQNATNAASVIGASFGGFAEYTDIMIKGIIRCLAAGTCIPSLTYSVAPVTTPTTYVDNILADSYISFYPIGTNTVTTVGNAWS